MKSTPNNSNNNQMNQQKVNDMIKKLSPQQTKQVESILNDKNALNKLLSSPQAQQLIKKFGGK